MYCKLNGHIEMDRMIARLLNVKGLSCSKLPIVGLVIAIYSPNIS